MPSHFFAKKKLINLVIDTMETKNLEYEERDTLRTFIEDQSVNVEDLKLKSKIEKILK